jgi:hypothetical protein
MTRLLSHFESGKLGAWLRRKIWPRTDERNPPRPITLKERMAALRPEIKPQHEGKETA